MPDEVTITVATDGSDHSLRILPHAQCIAENLGARIELVRVIERDEITQDRGEDESSAIERVRSSNESKMEADLRRYGIDGDVRIIVAPHRENPADTLLSIASRGSLLAMHSRGRGGIARLLQGSVAMGVVKQVTQPVLLGGPELLPPPVNGETYRLLATTDLSPDADHALRGIAPLLELGNFHVTLLHVHFHAPVGVDNEAERARHEAILKEKRDLLPASVTVETRIREIPIGAGVDTAIMEVADDVDAQSIVMATHGHSAKRHLLMGSVAMSVLGRCRLPLIVMRAPAEK